MDSKFPEFVEIFEKLQSRGMYDTGFFRELSKSRHLDIHGKSAGRFALKLLEGIEPNGQKPYGFFWARNAVRTIVSRLREMGATEELVRKLVNKALELGADSGDFEL